MSSKMVLQIRVLVFYMFFIVKVLTFTLENNLGDLIENSTHKNEMRSILKPVSFIPSRTYKSIKSINSRLRGRRQSFKNRNLRPFELHEHKMQQAARLADLQTELFNILDRVNIQNIDDPNIPEPVMKLIKQSMYKFIVESDVPESNKKIALHKLFLF